MNWLQELLENTVFQALLAVIAIISFVYAIITQRNNKERKELTYVIESNTLIRSKKSKYEKLSIAYAERQIDSLCVSNVVLWNNGNRTLNRVDVVEKKEITITAADNHVILDVEILAATEETNKFSAIKVDDRCVKLTFDYIDPKDGVAVQIIHTGTADAISLDCKIKGGRPLRCYINESFPNMVAKIINPYRQRKFWAIAGGIATVFFVVFTLLSTISVFMYDPQNVIVTAEKEVVSAQSPQHSLAVLFTTLWIGSILLTALYIPFIKKTFSVGIPQKLRKYLK